ncbi:MAG: transposase, partial [Anaerolineales bacterium]
IKSNWIRWQQPKQKLEGEREIRPEPEEILQKHIEPDMIEASQAPTPKQPATRALSANPPLDLLQRGTEEIDAIGSLLWDGGKFVISAGLSRHQQKALAAKLAELGDELNRRRAITLYIELPDFNEELLLFASPWNQDLSLVTLHAMETPFRQVRRRSQELSEYLRSSAVEPIEPEIEAEAQAPAAPKFAPDQEALPEDWVPKDQLSPAQQAALDELASMEPPPPDPEPGEQQSPSPEPTHELPKDWIPTESRFDALLAMIEEEVPNESPSPPDDPAKGPKDHLKFSLVLIPQFPEQQLTPSLSHQLERWVHRICLAWDWQAEEINVASEYLHMVIELNPSSAPAEAAEQLKSDLSRRILEAHPDWAEAIPSGRFFARPHLLTAGTEVSRIQIQTFIETTRRSQGIDN